MGSLDDGSEIKDDEDDGSEMKDDKDNNIND